MCIMRWTAGLRVSRVGGVAVLLLWTIALRGQAPSFVIVTPDKATLLMGQSRTFRLVNQDGQMQHGVSWDISDPGAFEIYAGDDLLITAKRAGDFLISARLGDRRAKAMVRVLDGDTLPIGTVKWSSGTIPGCKTTKVAAADPSTNGPGIFEESQCEDGPYVAAYTSDGIQLWRRKMAGPGEQAVKENKPAAPAVPPVVPTVARPFVPPVVQPVVPPVVPPVARINPSEPNVCDAVSVGASQQEIRELLRQRNLSFSEGAPDERMWAIEEPNVQCNLWFNEKGSVTRKRKIFVNE